MENPGFQPRRFTGLIAIFVVSVALTGCSPLTVINVLSPSRHYAKTPDLSYADGARRKIDVYHPLAAQPRAPLVVYLYGGGWNGGSREKYEFVAASLTRAGIVVMVPDYRLYPEVTFPDFVEDAAKAVAWAVSNAERFGADPEQLYLMGHSAGAHIAGLLALDERYLAGYGHVPKRLAGFIGLSGAYDFLPIESGYLLEVFPEPVRNESQPINFVTARAPRTLLIHGADDGVVAVGNSLRLADKLRDNGVPVTLRIYEGVGHARVVAALAPPLDFIATTLDDCIAFISGEEHLARAWMWHQ